MNHLTTTFTVLSLLILSWWDPYYIYMPNFFDHLFIFIIVDVLFYSLSGVIPERIFIQLNNTGLILIYICVLIAYLKQ